MPLRSDGIWFHDTHPTLQPWPDIDLHANVLVTKTKSKGHRGIVINTGSGIPRWLYTVELDSGEEQAFYEEELEVLPVRTFADDVRDMQRDGKTIREIAAEIDKSKSAVSRILSRYQRDIQEAPKTRDKERIH